MRENLASKLNLDVFLLLVVQNIRPGYPGKFKNAPRCWKATRKSHCLSHNSVNESLSFL